MRINCDVAVVDRTLATHLNKAGKSSRAQLSIGRRPCNGPLKDCTMFMMLCTAKDKNGTKYLIKDNIQQVFTKFVIDGKATIRLIQPEQDLCISKADNIQLKSFINVLNQAAHGKSIDNIIFSSLSPASSKTVEKPKTSLVILNKKDYPLTTNFPATIELLKISGCRMKKIDGRIFELQHLIQLDLTDNCIELIPEEISKLQTLFELRLAHNNFKFLAASVCLKQTLQKTLKLLDLSSNNIKHLPLQLCELRNLVTIKLDNNMIEQLPPTIGRLKKLQYMSACNNKLRVLPASFFRLKLEGVDLFGNCFDTIEEYKLSSRSVNVPTLVECAARCIKKNRVPYSEDGLHLHLCQYLDSARQCWCGCYCFQCSVSYIAKADLRRISSTVTAVDLIGGTRVPVEGFLCSPQCLAKFQSNPNAYWK